MARCADRCSCKTFGTGFKVLWSVLLLGTTYLCSGFPHPIEGGSDRFIRRYFREEGLNSHNIFIVTQDRDGFIWLGTEGGLIRYDGNHFRRFGHPNATSLGDNHVYAICEDQEGFLWLGTRSGSVCRFDKETQSFRSWQLLTRQATGTELNKIYAVVADTEGVIWAGTMVGLERFEPEKDGFVPHPLASAEDAPGTRDAVTWLYLSPRRPELLWVCTANNGLKCLDRSSGNLRHYVSGRSRPNSLLSNTVLSIVESPRDQYWICTDRGLNRLDLKTGRMEAISSREGLPGDRLSDRTFCAAADRLGRIWVGTMGAGLRVYSAEGALLQTHQHDADRVGSLSNNHVNHLFVDRSNLVWVGTVWGLNQIPADEPAVRVLRHVPYQERSLSNNWINDMAQDGRGDLWIATDNGLNRLERSGGGIRRYLQGSGGMGESSFRVCRCVYVDFDGRVWTGTSTGLLRLGETGEADLSFVHDGGDGRSLSHSAVNSIMRDSRGRLWVGTQIGLNLMVDESGAFARFFDRPELMGEWYKNSFSSMVEDRRGNLWFGTAGGGLYRYREGTFSHYLHSREDVHSLPGDQIFDMLCDGEGRLWVAGSGGLCLWQGAGRFDRFRIGEEGLSVVAMAQGGEGRLWLAGPEQLLRFNPLSRQIEAGLDLSRFGIYEASPSALVQTKEAGLFLGGLDGMIAINGEQGFSGQRELTLAVSELQLLGSGGLHISVKGSGKPMGLKSGDFPLTIRYTVLDCSEGGAIRFAYRLVSRGEEEWVDMGGTRELTLTDLESGHYRFELKARRLYQDWNAPRVVLRLEVVPPVWDRLWFRGSSAAFLALLGFWVHVQRLRRIRRKLKMDSALDRFLSTRGVSPREMEIIGLIIKNRSNLEIAGKLGISLSTVKNHLHNIYCKLNVRNRIQLISMVQDVQKHASKED